MTAQDAIATHRSNREILGRDEINDVEAILAKHLDPGTIHAVPVGGDAQFTWNYGRERDALTRLYEKAKLSQWNATDQFDWSMEVDQERLADHMATHNPETVFLKQLAANDSSCPLRNWGDDEFRKLAFESQNYMLSQLTHGEQGALLCTAKIVEQVPWIEAKYYASTQVVDEARHVEVFSRYLIEKLSGIYEISSPLSMILDSILLDDRWDVTYLGMQIMVEGLALAAFSLVRQLTPDPLLQEILKYVMSDEARHVAFGVLSLREVYDDMTAGEIRERQEFAFEVGVRLRDRQFPAPLYEAMGVDPRKMLTWYLDNVPKFTNSLLFCKIVPNVRKLGLLDAGDGWLRKKYEEIDVIQYEDWVDTVSEYEAFDAVTQPRREEL
jgi:hypothetical protein